MNDAEKKIILVEKKSDGLVISIVCHGDIRARISKSEMIDLMAFLKGFSEVFSCDKFVITKTPKKLLKIHLVEFGVISFYCELSLPNAMNLAGFLDVEYYTK